LTIAAHYRLAPAAGPALESLAERLAAESGAALAVQGGKMVFELRPVGKDKGTVIAEFLDEAPFRGGMSVKVGAKPTEANAYLPDIDAVNAWLERLTAQ